MPANAQAGPSSPPPSREPTNLLEFTDADTTMEDAKTLSDTIGSETPAVFLKPLKDLLWPPEPDSSIFTDPLKRDDPKPLRHEELLRIGEMFPRLSTKITER